jgi:tellurite resistance protein
VVELVPAPRRAQVLRDLVLIARADGRIQAAERAVMRKLAVDLEIEPEFVDHVLASDSELD